MILYHYRRLDQENKLRYLSSISAWSTLIHRVLLFLVFFSSPYYGFRGLHFLTILWFSWSQFSHRVIVFVVSTFSPSYGFRGLPFLTVLWFSWSPLSHRVLVFFVSPFWPGYGWIQPSKQLVKIRTDEIRKFIILWRVKKIWTVIKSSRVNDMKSMRNTEVDRHIQFTRTFPAKISWVNGIHVIRNLNTS